jgi:alanine racemase
MSTADRAGAVLTIDLAAIVANWRLLCVQHPCGPVAGVVKADGYGLGARPIAQALYAAGCRHFFVALLDEAMEIRQVVPDAMLAVLGGLIAGSEADYLAHGIVPVLGSLAEIDAWTAAARSVSARGETSASLEGDITPCRHPRTPYRHPRESGDPGWVPTCEGMTARVTVRAPDDSIIPSPSAILHIDTGMSRLGLDARELAALQQDHARLSGIDLRYVMTHLVASEAAADPLNERQRERFAAACAGLPAAPRSFANSSGIFLGSGWGSDLARPGAALYGINPTPGAANPMRLAVHLRARVLAVRDVPAGTGVGYNATWRAPGPTRIATAAIGYADGLRRTLSNQGRAFFDGKPVPLVGRVSMDLTTFDVTEAPGVVPGAWLEIIGPAQTPDDLAVASGTNGYEVLTSLGRRFHRIYQSA